MRNDFFVILSRASFAPDTKPAEPNGAIKVLVLTPFAVRPASVFLLPPGISFWGFRYPQEIQG